MHIDIDFGFVAPPPLDTVMVKADLEGKDLVLEEKIPATVVQWIHTLGFSEQEKKEVKIDELHAKLTKCIEEHFEGLFVQDARARMESVKEGLAMAMGDAR